MLILTRKPNQSFIIMPDATLDPSVTVGELFATGPIEVVVTQIRASRVKFSVFADSRLLILRRELYRGTQ